MKTVKILYWATTAIFSLMMSFSGFLYLTSAEIQQAFVQLGFPGFFRIELGIAKLLGSVLLLIPIPPRFKEWVYAGFTINLVSAFIAHVASGHPVSVFIMPLVFLAGLAVSYITYHKLHQREFVAQTA